MTLGEAHLRIISSIERGHATSSTTGSTSTNPWSMRRGGPANARSAPRSAKPGEDHQEQAGKRQQHVHRALVPLLLGRPSAGDLIQQGAGAVSGEWVSERFEPLQGRL